MIRDYRLDNARFFLNVLVVFGHFFGPWTGNQTFIENNIYLFHLIFTMPCLAFISGVFSSEILTKDKYAKMFERFLIPYFIFNCILYFILTHFISQARHEYFFFDPNAQLWYLLSLATWKLMLPLFNQLRFSFLFALILSVGIGYVDTLGAETASIYAPVDIKKDTLSIMRSVVLFPYFLLGFNFKYYLANLKNHYFLSLIIFSLLIIFCFCLSSTQYDVFTRLAYGSYSFNHCGLEGWSAIIYRMIIFSLGLIGIYGFLCLIPKKMNTITLHGQNSMYSYILHIFPVMFIGFIGLNKLFPISTFYSMLNIFINLIIAFVIAYIITTKVSVKLFKPLVEPSCSFILNKN